MALKTVCRYAVVALVLAVTMGIRVFPQPSPPAEIPFQFSRAFGLMLIRAEVNGKPAVLVLDSASNHTTISSRFVDVATPHLRDTVSSRKGSGYSGTGVFTRGLAEGWAPRLAGSSNPSHGLEGNFQKPGGEHRRFAGYGFSQRIRNCGGRFKATQIDP